MAYPIPESEVIKTENTIGSRLPSAYRLSMMAENGKNFVITDEDEWELFPLKDTSDRKKLARTVYDILKETESAKNWPNFPENGLAVANNGMGDLMFFRQSEGALDDTVYAYWHETGTITTLAASFDELERE